MNLLVLAHEFPPYPGGIGTYSHQIALAAAEMGHKVTVLAPDFGLDNSGFDARQPFAVKRFSGHLYSKKGLPRVVWELLKIRPWRYDLVHLTDLSFLLPLHYLIKIISVKHIVTVHGTDILSKTKSPFMKMLGSPAIFAGAEYVVANSRFTANLFRKNYSYVAAEKVRAALLGVNAEWFRKSADEVDPFKRFNLPRGRKLLLTVARLDERKGQDKMLEALAMLPDAAKEDMAYVIAGKEQSQTYLARLKELAETCGVPVIFTGAISNAEVRALYGVSWLFCMPNTPHPGRVEGFGLAYLEAAAQGLPSLATAMGGVPEVIDNAVTGILLESPAAGAIRDTLLELMRNPGKVPQMGEAARARAETFVWRKTAEQTYPAA